MLKTPTGDTTAESGDMITDTAKKYLTWNVIRKLAVPASGHKLHFDAEVPGMALRVTAKGEKAFVLKYRIRGTQRSWTFGWPTEGNKPDPGTRREDVRYGVPTARHEP
jgi:hypothetical protein